MKQKIKEEEMQVKVIERAQAISLQEQEIQRKERELDATIRRPAEAEKFSAEKIAEASRQKIILEAQAQAEATQVNLLLSLCQKQMCCCLYVKNNNLTNALLSLCQK